MKKENWKIGDRILVNNEEDIITEILDNCFITAKKNKYDKRNGRMITSNHCSIFAQKLNSK